MTGLNSIGRKCAAEDYAAGKIEQICASNLHTLKIDLKPSQIQFGFTRLVICTQRLDVYSISFYAIRFIPNP